MCDPTICITQVPFESLKRTTRDRKYLLDELENSIAGLAVTAASHPPPNRMQTTAALDNLITQLRTLKRKVRTRVLLTLAHLLCNSLTTLACVKPPMHNAAV